MLYRWSVELLYDQQLTKSHPLSKQFEQFIQNSGYWRRHMRTENPSWYALETILDRPSWSELEETWRITRPALRTDGYRSQYVHRFEGDRFPRTLEVETVTAWGSAALDTLLRTTEAPFGAFITCNRLGLLLTRPGIGPTPHLRIALLEGQKTQALYLQFTTYGQLLRRS